MAQKTPLYETHLSLGGKMVDFGGFLLPMQYGGIVSEHLAVRNDCGIFDVSHMGEATVSGSGALEFLNRTLTNDFSSLKIGAVRYTIMLYDNGGTVDDLLVYRLGEQSFLLVLNASNTEKDVEWLKGNLFGDVSINDISHSVAQIAVQGPRSPEIMSKLCEGELPTKYYTFTSDALCCSKKCLISRTGYTGEVGYEIYLHPSDASAVFKAFIDAGVVPCGLGARDTLRLEAAMPLYGHELSEHIDPVTAGLDFAVKLQKPDFIGRNALVAAGETKKKRVGLKVTGRGIVREHQDVFLNGEKVGVTSSGTYCPYLEGSYAMAYIDKNALTYETEYTVDVRGRMITAKLTDLPFYNSKK